MPTIYDVARHAGVSPKTVSRVLNGDAPVNVRTREIVRDAIDALGYVPSSAARSMRSNRSGLVGLVTGAISGSALDSDLSGLPELLIVQAIQATLAEAGLTLLISDTGGDGARVGALTRTLAEHRVEALIYVADHHREVALPEAWPGRPLLLVNCFDQAGTPCVLPDDTAGQRELVRRLIAAGHRRIAFLTLPDDLVAYRLRLAGYREALEAAGIGYDETLVDAVGLHHHGPREESLIGEAVERMVALADPPTVFCCGNDRMALQLYGVLRSRGHAVPDSVSVAGYDDYRAISETLYPPLTTAVLPYREMGRRAAEWVLARLRGDEAAPAVTIRVGGPVVWRRSVTEIPSTRRQ